MGADNRSDSNVKEADGFYLGPDRKEVLVADKQARQKITELETRVAELEKLPRIWTGTDEEYEQDNAAGKIRDGDIIITPGAGEDETAAASSGTEVQEGENA